MEVVKNVPENTIELHNALDCYIAFKMHSDWYILVKNEGSYSALGLSSNKLLPDTHSLSVWYDKSHEMHAFKTLPEFCSFLASDE